jgi:hypothetical protein
MLPKTCSNSSRTTPSALSDSETPSKMAISTCRRESVAGSASSGGLRSSAGTLRVQRRETDTSASSQPTFLSVPDDDKAIVRERRNGALGGTIRLRAGVETFAVNAGTTSDLGTA